MTPIVCNTGGRNGASATGFTLVEILVVMVIVGMMAGIAVLSVGGNAQKSLTREITRLQHVMRLAADKALIEGAEYGLLLDGDSYQILRFDDVTLSWQEMAKQSFSRHQLPETVSLRVEAEGEVVDLVALSLETDQENNDEETSSGPLPSVLLLSSGEITPFTITLALSGTEIQYRLSSDGIGALTVDRGES